MRGIRMENGRILYFGNLAGYVTGNKAVVDPLFSGDGLNRFLEKQKGIREVEWRDGVYAGGVHCGRSRPRRGVQYPQFL